MTMRDTIPQTSRSAVEAVRSLPCPYCWAGAGGALDEACGIIPVGDHFGRWAEARRRGLISAEQLGAAMDTLAVITNAAMVVTEPPGPVAALAALGAVWSDDFDAYAGGELDASKLHCALCQCAPCRCPAFGTPEYFALIDFRHGRGGAK
jgi:hypothetical protein